MRTRLNGNFRMPPIIEPIGYLSKSDSNPMYKGWDKLNTVGM